MPNPHEPLPPLKKRCAEPREHRQVGASAPDAVEDDALATPDEPRESERSLATPTRTIRDGEIQGHPREMQGDRDSQ